MGRWAFKCLVLVVCERVVNELFVVVVCGCCYALIVYWND